MKYSRMLNRFTRLLPSFLIPGLLLACSGDDSELAPDKPVEPEMQTGILIDSEVGGVNYFTETQNGITNSAGEYTYLDGETVTFTVGDIVLGSAPAGPKLSPLSLASTPNATLETEEVQNIAAFLQTLDSDNDPSNGIIIETSTVEAISVSTIDFTKPIIHILGSMVAEINLANDSELTVVYPDAAAAHLATSLGETYEANDLVFSMFIPYVENKFGNQRSYYWIHETDEEGNLVISTYYEKYPHRPVQRITYKEMNEQGQPVALEVAGYDHEGNVGTAHVREVEIFYSESGVIESSLTIIADVNNWIKTWYQKWDEEQRVLEYTMSRNPNEGASTKIEDVYNEAGDWIERKLYDLQSNTPLFKNVYAYTSWGDYESQIRYDTSGQEVARFEYFYREDRTLERIQYTSGENTSETYYDEGEKQI